jgi:hypothetical protein
MNAILKLLVAVVVVSGFFPAVYAESPGPLVLPAADKMVIGDCYLRAVTGGLQKIEKREFSQRSKGSEDKFLAGFVQKMKAAGFKDVSLLNKCSNDDVAGAITVQFVFPIQSSLFGSETISVNTFIKVPGEKWVKKAAAMETVSAGTDDESIEKTAARVSQETINTIKEAQARSQPASTAAAVTVESKN